MKWLHSDIPQHEEELVKLSRDGLILVHRGSSRFHVVVGSNGHEICDDGLLLGTHCKLSPNKVYQTSLWVLVFIFIFEYNAGTQVFLVSYPIHKQSLYRSVIRYVLVDAR